MAEQGVLEREEGVTLLPAALERKVLGIVRSHEEKCENKARKWRKCSFFSGYKQ